MKRISFKGVIIGNVVDIVSTNIAVLPLMTYMLISSAPVRDLAASTHVLTESSAFRVWSGVLGGLCSVLGGYVSARIAKHDEVLNGALSSILCTGFGLYALLGGGATGHSMLHIALLPLSPALGALGGYLRSRRSVQQF